MQIDAVVINASPLIRKPGSQKTGVRSFIVISPSHLLSPHHTALVEPHDLLVRALKNSNN